MPASIQVGGTATFTFTEWTGPTGSGTQVAPTDPAAVTVQSSQSAIATVAVPVVLASGVITAKVTGVAAGTVSIVGTDPANGLAASDTLTVTAGAESATGTLSTP
jgi:uncharacterized protein YjdB